MVEERMLEKLAAKTRARFPSVPFIVGALVAVQFVWRLWNGATDMIDVYGHLQFLTANRQQLIQYLELGITAVFSPTGSIVTFVLGLGYLVFDNRSRKSSPSARMPAVLPSTTFAVLIRQVYQSRNRIVDRANTWLLLSIKAGDRPISVIRWEVLVKWQNSAEPVLAREFWQSAEPADIDDDEWIWWQGTDYSRNLAWGNLSCSPAEQINGHLYCRFEKAKIRRLDGPISELTVKMWDIEGNEITATRVFNGNNG